MIFRFLLPLLLPAFVVAGCRPDGPGLHGRLDVDTRDSVFYVFHADGTLTGPSGAQPASATTTIDGSIVLAVDSTTDAGLIWTYSTPRLLVRSKMAGTPDLADSSPVPPVRFATDRSGRPIGRDSLGVQVGGIGMMVHGDLRQMFLPAQIGAREAGARWSESTSDTVYDGPLPGVNRTTRQFVYDGVVDTLGEPMARISARATIRTEPLNEADSTMQQISATTTTLSSHYYSIEDGLLLFLRSETSIDVRPAGLDPATPPTVQQTLRMEMRRSGK